MMRMAFWIVKVADIILKAFVALVAVMGLAVILYILLFNRNWW